MSSQKEGKEHESKTQTLRTRLSATSCVSGPSKARSWCDWEAVSIRAW